MSHKETDETQEDRRVTSYIDKVIPTLLTALVIAVVSAYVELKEISVKISYIEKQISAYHEKD